MIMFDWTGLEHGVGLNTTSPICPHDHDRYGFLYFLYHAKNLVSTELSIVNSQGSSLDLKHTYTLHIYA